MDYLSLGSGVALDDLWLLPEPAGAEDQEVDCFSGLLRITVLRELAQAIYELNEDLFQQLKVIADSMLKRFEALDHQMVFCVLCCQGKNIEDDFPARLDELGFQKAELSCAHHNILLDFLLARVQIVEHNGLEWLQEHFLVAEVLTLFLLKELIRQLSQRIDGINYNIEVLVLANHGEMISKSAPNALPLESNSVHVQRGHFDKFLKAELLGTVLLRELVSGNLAEILDKVNDCVWIEPLTLQEDQLNLVCIDLLSYDLRIPHENLLMTIEQVAWLSLDLRNSLTLKVFGVWQVAEAEHAHLINFGETIQHVIPTISQAFSIMNGKIQQFSYAVDVLLFDFSAGADLGELAQGGDECISNFMDFVVATDSDCVNEALQAQVCDVLVLRLVEHHAEHCEIGRPGIFKERSDG